MMPRPVHARPRPGPGQWADPHPPTFRPAEHTPVNIHRRCFKDSRAMFYTLFYKYAGDTPIRRIPLFLSESHPPFPGLIFPPPSRSFSPLLPSPSPPSQRCSAPKTSPAPIGDSDSRPVRSAPVPRPDAGRTGPRLGNSSRWPPGVRQPRCRDSEGFFRVWLSGPTGADSEGAFKFTLPIPPIRASPSPRRAGPRPRRPAHGPAARQVRVPAVLRPCQRAKLFIQPARRAARSPRRSRRSRCQSSATVTRWPAGRAPELGARGAIWRPGKRRSPGPHRDRPGGPAGPGRAGPAGMERETAVASSPG
jgi:hypothetical protein